MISTDVILFNTDVLSASIMFGVLGSYLTFITFVRKQELKQVSDVLKAEESRNRNLWNILFCYLIGGAISGLVAYVALFETYTTSQILVSSFGVGGSTHLLMKLVSIGEPSSSNS